MATAILMTGCSSSRGPAASEAPPKRSTAASSTEALPSTTTSTAGPAPVAPRLDGVAFLDPRHGYGLFDQDSGPTCSTSVGRTDDGGAHFSALVEADRWACGGYRGATSLAFDDHGDGFLYGTGLYVSHDAGRSWAPAPTSEPVVAVAALGYSVWMVQAAACPPAGAPGGCHLALSVSADGGRTWRPAATLGGPSAGGNTGMLSELALGQTWLVRTTTTAAYIVAPPRPDPSGGPDSAPLWHTADSGRTWTTSEIPCSMAAMSVVVSAAPGGKLWAVCAGQPSAGYQGKSVETSTDGGATWRLMARCPLPGPSSTTPCRSHPPDFGYLGGIDAVSDTTAFLVGPRSELMESRDGGATWDAVAPVASGTAGGTDQVIFFDPAQGLVLGDDGDANELRALWSTGDGGLHWRATIPQIG